MLCKQSETDFKFIGPDLILTGRRFAKFSAERFLVVTLRVPAGERGRKSRSETQVSRALLAFNEFQGHSNWCKTVEFSTSKDSHLKGNLFTLVQSQAYLEVVSMEFPERGPLL